MSVAYWDAEGAHFPFKDEEGQNFAYHVVAESGVLLLMHQLDSDPWQVWKEFSPSGWREVAGTRFNQYPSSAPGLDGKVTFGGPAKVVAS